jgi:glycosyltransferase involved in cell wall biosynthesis
VSAQKGAGQIKRPRLAIIVPAFNAEDTISKTLENLFFLPRTDYEILVVDDGSTDSTQRIVASGMRADSPVSLWSKNHTGLSDSRNLGLSKTNAEYVLFLDADDFIDTGALERVLKSAVRLRLDMALFDTEPFSPTNFFSQSFLEERRHYYKRRLSSSFSTLTGELLFARLMRRSSYLPSACLYITRVDFLKSTGTRFVPAQIFEDHPFTLELMLRANRVRYFRQTVHHRRLNPKSLTNTIEPPEAVRHLKQARLLCRRVWQRYGTQRSAAAISKLLARLDRQISKHQP